MECSWLCEKVKHSVAGALYDKDMILHKDLSVEIMYIIQQVLKSCSGKVPVLH